MEVRKRKFCLPYLLLGGLLTGLTLVFPQLGFLEWITMIPIFIGAYRLCGSSRYGFGKTYWFGFLTVFSFYFVNYHWFLYLHPLESVGIDRFSSAVIVTAGWVGLPILQAVLGGFVFLLFKLIHHTMIFRHSPVLRPFVFAALWIVFEWSSTLHWTGVPWGRLCLGQSEYLPMLQSASLFGSYFVSFLILLVNGLIAYIILYHKRRARVILCSVTAVVLLVANLLTGVLLLNADTAKDADTLRVGVIQGNINSHEPWNYDRLVETKEVFATLTRQAVSEGAELVIWPETAFPYILNQNYSVQSYLSDLAYECDVTILMGALYLDESGEKYNALYRIDPNGEISKDMYFKRHLVPFGEYIPLKDLIMTVIPPLAEFCMTMDNNLTAGKDPALIQTEWGEIGGLICFDSIYEQLALDSVNAGASLLVLSSNDSWFYDSAAIHQHEAQARLRSIETGRYLLRSGTTGISSIVTDKGEHLAYIEPLVRDYAVDDVKLFTHKTLYAQIGNSFVYACILFCVGVSIVGIVIDKRKQTEKE